MQKYARFSAYTPGRRNFYTRPHSRGENSNIHTGSPKENILCTPALHTEVSSAGVERIIRHQSRIKSIWWRLDLNM